MKIIISSLYLKSKILKALQHNLQKIKIQNNMISFICMDNKKIEVELVHLLEIEEEILIEANPLQWNRIYDFLNIIDHQPVIMYLEHDFETDIKIKFTNIIANF